jgi:hypothetical protein
MLLKCGCLIAAFVGLFAVAAGLIVPIADIDLWWHLATGRHLMQTGQFLSEDPFSIAGTQISPERELILNGYWLSQILFYGIYRAFDLMGIVFLRAALLLVPPVAALVFGWRRAPWSPVVVLLSLLCGWAMLGVSGIRPNHLTVAFVPLLFILLESVGYAAERQGAGYSLRKAWLLPPFMLVWANLHGGFLAGIAIIFLFVLSETVTQAYQKGPLKPVLHLWGIALVSVLATLLSPVGVQIYIQFLSSSSEFVVQRTSEYLSPFTLAQQGVFIYWPYFILLAVSLSVVALTRFRMSTTKLLLIFALIIVSLTAFRYAPLFVGGAVMLMMSDVQRLFDKAKEVIRLPIMIATISLALFLTFHVVSGFSQGIGRLSNGAVDLARFPVAAVDFLEKQNLSGVFFNHMNWGGYLAWRQLPGSKSFIDGRSLNLPLLHAYTRVLWLPDEAQKILDEHNVDLIMVPRLNPFTGELYALTDFFWKSPEWRLVYRDRLAMILTRSKSFNVVEIDKSWIYRDVLSDVERAFTVRPDSAHLKKALALAKTRLFEKATTPF